MKSFLKDFKDFIATGNMVELAVAFILGLAIKAVIDAFIANVADPIIAAIFGKPNLDNFLTITLRKGKSNQSIVSFGAVLTQIISLALVGLVLFVAIKAYNKMTKQKDAAPAGPTEVDLLTEIRESLRSR